MKNNISLKLWFFAAICFIIIGILDKDTVFIVLGRAYICIGCFNLKKEKVMIIEKSFYHRVYKNDNSAHCNKIWFNQAKNQPIYNDIVISKQNFKTRINKIQNSNL